jgi:hypothetical protein
MITPLPALRDRDSRAALGALCFGFRSQLADLGEQERTWCFSVCDRLLELAEGVDSEFELV